MVWILKKHHGMTLVNIVLGKVEKISLYSINIPKQDKDKSYVDIGFHWSKLQSIFWCVQYWAYISNKRYISIINANIAHACISVFICICICIFQFYFLLINYSIVFLKETTEQLSKKVYQRWYIDIRWYFDQKKKI